LISRFDVYHQSEKLGPVALSMPGAHNVSNAVGAIATALELNIPFDVVSKAISEFSGVQRRFTVHADVAGVRIVDDYAHHPVEIRATLEAARQGFPNRRLIAVFQPHRYSRIRDLWDDFCNAFNDADRVLVCPVYAAGEQPIDHIDHERLAQEIARRGHRGAVVVLDLDDAVAQLARESKVGDLVITLGAGNVNQVCSGLTGALTGQEHA
jgi:UDP-N-acetylmuramate--alanine ligase